ncbi:hypothetical protein M408DRAFT_282700 [Serendipita vermifera MAFF 305830]|uniref:Uncharacterized protein n=1 Tax=Serendipita vermifera MAFF 305830 TaxID=933852 RepID=A0A0C3ARF1_SERVB|nr:hypothetical protein M408DRAFT_282700 [Serendipita vermifera MAFF 305830]
MSHSYHPKYGPVLSDEYGLDFGCDAFENSGPRRTSIYSENASYALSLQPTLEFYDIFNPTQTACVTYGASDNDNSFKHERPNSTTSLQMTNTGLSTRWQETNSTGQASGLSHFDAEVSHMFSPTSNNARCQSDSFLLGPTEDRRTAGNSRALPTGSGQVGSFLSNTLLPDTYRQPKLNVLMSGMMICRHS